MSKLSRVIATVGCVLAMSSCGGSGGGSFVEPEPEDFHPVTVQITNQRRVLCVVFADGSMGGLSCDWDHAG